MRTGETMWVEYECVKLTCLNTLRVPFPDDGPGSKAIQCLICGTFNRCILPAVGAFITSSYIEERGDKRDVRITPIDSMPDQKGVG